MGSVFCLTRRWRSSGSSSLSDSSASKASARVGSWTVRFRGATDDALEWNDGGGEFGCDERVFLDTAMGDGASSSSWALTCQSGEC